MKRFMLFILSPLCGLIFLYSGITFSHAQQLTKIPVENWVIKREINYSGLLEDQLNAGSIIILLDDQQTKYSDNGPSLFVNQIVQLKTLQAIENMGTVKLIYNSAYNSYGIHHINVIRNGEVIDMLPDARVTVDSYNAEINTSDHEGSNIVQIYLADIRKDDILDVAYSISGQNPAFGNRIIALSYEVASIKTNNVYRRYLVPNERNLVFHYNANHKKPEISHENQNTIYEWKWDQIEQTQEENNTPIWYPSFPSVAFNDFENWGDVASWASDLFKSVDMDNINIKNMAEELTQSTNTKIEKLTRILSFMQSNIRYTGLEIGRNGYRPFSPEEVLSRRYGDCKDQSVLLAALLRALEIDAWPALVNSTSGKLTEYFGATPIAFNHAIVKAEIDGKQYWLDPTISLSDGRLADLTPPRYEKALVLLNNEKKLSDIPLMERNANEYQISIEDNYSLPGGVYGELNWNRKTTFSGEMADYMRSSVDYIGVRQLGINLREANQSIYENIENSEFTTVEDNEDFYVINENYTVAKAGTYDQNRDQTEFGFAPRNIAELLITPDSVSERKTPFELGYPVRRQSIVNITAKGAVFVPYYNKISNDYFTYNSSGKYLDKGIFQMIYQFETHKEFVPVKDIKQYADDIDKIKKEMFFYIFSPGKPKNSSVEVYQPVHNRRGQMENKNSRNVYEKINLFISSEGLRYIDNSKDEILDILNDKELSVEAADNFYQLLIGYCLETSRTELALFYHDLHVKSNGKIPLPLITSLIMTLQKEKRIDDALEVINKEIKDLSSSKNSETAEILQSYLRQVYWQQRNFGKLAEVLQYIIETFPPKETYYRELGVVYDLLGKKNEAEIIRNKMTEYGFSDVKIEKPSLENTQKRIPRPLVRFPPMYPQKAAQSGIEGFAVTSFTVTESGEVKDCHVIESSPKYFFEKAACDAVETYYYYPAEKSEESGDIQNVKTRLEFVLSN